MINYDLRYVKNERDKEKINKFIQDYERKEPLKVIELENALVLPQKEADKTLYPYTWMGLGGVINEKGDFVEMSGIKSLYDDALVFGGKYEYKKEKVCDQEVVYMGAFQPHWGHFLMEYCTRLWYVIRDGKKCKIAYSGFGCAEGEMSESNKEFFRLLNIAEEDLIDVRTPTRFKKVIIPEQSFLRNQYFTNEYKEMMEYLYNNVDKLGKEHYEKIYFTRVPFISNNKNDKEHGELEIQNTFELNGYKILDPEKLSVQEQIYYVHNCKEFAVIPGGASANCVFASDNTKRIYIQKASDVIPDMFQIDQMTKCENVVFLDCYHQPFKRFPKGYGEGPHFLGYTKKFKVYLEDNEMKKLKRREYFKGIAETWIWLLQIIAERILLKMRKLLKR